MEQAAQDHDEQSKGPIHITPDLSRRNTVCPGLGFSAKWRDCAAL
jgi:hypothetical protein